MDRNDSGAPPAPPALTDDALLAVSFADLVRRRLRPVVATLADGPDAGSIYREVVEQVERTLVALALERTGGNQQRAARLLGIGRNTLRAKRPGEGARGNGRRP